MLSNVSADEVALHMIRAARKSQVITTGVNMMSWISSFPVSVTDSRPPASGFFSCLLAATSRLSYFGFRFPFALLPFFAAFVAAFFPAAVYGYFRPPTTGIVAS